MDEVRGLALRLAAAVHEAGAAILEVYGREDRGIVLKGDGSPVTAADHAAHERLAASLPRILDIPVMSEESPLAPVSVRRGWRRFWCVDPLDGTAEFVRRSGRFTVNVGLVEDGHPIAGAVFAPTTRTTYVGVVGEGATRTGPDGTVRLLARPPEPGSRLRVVARARDPTGAQAAFLARLPPHDLVESWDVLEICTVAEGRADVQVRFRGAHEWDTAAGHAILKAAGGDVFTVDGVPLGYNKAEVRNPRFLATAGFDVRPYLAGLQQPPG